MKIGIIGLGNVGSTVAYTLLLENLADELVLIDTNTDKLNAEIIEMQDVSQNLPHRVAITPAPVIRNTFRDGGGSFHIETDYGALADADIVIFAAADLSKITMADRLGELPITSAIADAVAPRLKASGFSGILLSVSNPCDVIAQHLWRQTGFPSNKVIGSGALLDTNRLKNRTGREDVLVVGEHGESQVAVHDVSDELANQARLTGWNIFSVKRYTNFGIASCVARIIRTIQDESGEELPVSTYDEEADAYYSTWTRLDRNGVVSRRLPELTERERAQLDKSVARIKEFYSKIHGKDTSC